MRRNTVAVYLSGSVGKPKRCTVLPVKGVGREHASRVSNMAGTAGVGCSPILGPFRASAARLQQFSNQDDSINVEDILVIDEVIEPSNGGSSYTEGSGVIEDWGEAEFVSGSTSGFSSSSAGAGAASSSSAGHSSSRFEKIRSIDGYARARVLNFVRRHDPSGSDQSPFKIEEGIHASEVDDNADDGVELARATLTIPMPDPRFGTRVAEGIAGTAKDAEHVASMHAERIINALGLQLYGMPSSQERYALQLRKSSGGALWAPLPSDAPKPFTTASPPPLMQRDASAKAMQSRLQSDPRDRSRRIGGTVSVASTQQEYTLTCRSAAMGRYLEYAIASPNFLDTNAMKRVKGFLAAYNVTLAKATRLIRLRDAPRMGSKGPTAASTSSVSSSNQAEDNFKAHIKAKVEERDEEFEFEEWDADPSQLQFPDERGEVISNITKNTRSKRGPRHDFIGVRDSATSDAMLQERGVWYLCQLTIPGTPEDIGPVVAMGRAMDTKIAMQLACMHAELLIDALGMSIFPLNATLQLEHSRECARVGRWAVEKASMMTAEGHAAEAGVVTPAQQEAYRTIKPLQFTLDDLSKPGMATTTSQLQADISHGGDGDEAFASPRTSVIDLDGNDSHGDAILTHAKLIERVTLTNIDVDFQDRAARSRLMDYLRRMEAEHTAASNTGVTHGTLIDPTTDHINFFTEKMGATNHTYRASLTLPVPNVLQYGRRVACGVGYTEEAAENMCAMHALQILGVLQIPVYSDTVKQQDYYNEMVGIGATAAHYLEASREALVTQLAAQHPPAPTNSLVHEINSLTGVPSPPLYKFLTRDRKGRLFFGYNRAEEDIEWGGKADKRPSEQAYEKMLQAGQRANHRDFWATTPDATVPSNLYDARALGSSADLHPLLVDGVTFGPNGGDRIIVPPHAELDAERMFLHTLTGARHLDSKALDRMYCFLERGGRPLGSYSTHTFHEEEGSSGPARRVRTLYRVVCPLPVPAHFGYRIAVGEAPTANLALRCAAIHAELLIDSIGIRLYDHDVFQRKHAETARQMGRWAPLPETTIPFEEAPKFPSPPAVRMEEANSLVWQSVLRSRQDPTTATSAASGASAQPPSSSSSSSSPTPNSAAFASASASHQEKMAYQSQVDEALDADGFSFLKDVGDGEDLLDNDGDSEDTVANATTASEEAMDLAKYESFVGAKLRLSSKNRVNFFFHSRGSISKMDRWSVKPKGSRSKVFFSAMVMPFPPEYGVRIARAAATSRRESMMLCLAHAERLIDMLGFQSSKYPEQQWAHYNACKAEGRYCPTPFTMPSPTHTPTTFGLKILAEVAENAVPTMPLYNSQGALIRTAQVDPSSAIRVTNTNGETELLANPLAPTPIIKDPHDAWNVYCKQCETFIIRADNNRMMAAAEANITPRSGEPFEDETLDVIEKFKLSKLAIISLRDFAKAKGFEVPDRLDAVHVGTGQDKKFYASTPVLGTPFTAHGLSDVRHDAICIAAMHYQQMLNKILVTNAMAKAGVLSGGVGGGFDDGGGHEDDSLYNSTQQTFTAKGKRMAVRFFAELMPPHKQVKETIRRPLTAADDYHHVMVTVELEDAVGLKQMIKHEAKVKREADEEEEEALSIVADLRDQVVAKCYNDLFNALTAKVQTFTTFLQLLKQHPKLQLEKAVRAKLGGREVAELHDKVRAVMLTSIQNAANNALSSLGATTTTTAAAVIPTARSLGPGSDLDDPTYVEKLERTAMMGKIAVNLHNSAIIQEMKEKQRKAQIDKARAAGLPPPPPPPTDPIQRLQADYPFLRAEILREEHTQLLVSYISQKPLADVASFDQDVTAVMERPSTTTTPAADRGSIASANTVLDNVDAAFVDTASRTLSDLARNSFVVSFNMNFDEAKKLVSERTNKINPAGQDSLAPTSLNDGLALSGGGGGGGGGGNAAAGSPESLVRFEELTVALPTLFGAVTTFIASRLCKQWKLSMPTPNPNGHKADTTTAAGGVQQQQQQISAVMSDSLSTRAELDRAIALAKVLVTAALIPNKGVYDCAVTAVAAGTSDDLMLLSDQHLASIVVNGNGEANTSAVANLTLSERCLRLTAESVLASDPKANIKKPPRIVALATQRKQIHSIVQQSLKELREQLIIAGGDSAAPTSSHRSFAPASLPNKLSGSDPNATATRVSHPDVAKIRALMTSVDEAFNSTNAQVMRTLTTSSNTTSANNSERIGGGIGASAAAQTNNSAAMLKVATSAAAIPVLFDACATIALTPNFSVNLDPKTLAALAPLSTTLPADGSTTPIPPTSLLADSSLRALMASTKPSGEGNTSSAAPSTSAGSSDGTSTANTHTNSDSSVPTYKVDTRIDYSRYPLGSRMPGGGKVRVVPQSFGLSIPIASPSAATNSNSSSSPSPTSSSWASNIGQKIQQKGGAGGWAASVTAARTASASSASSSWGTTKGGATAKGGAVGGGASSSSSSTTASLPKKTMCATIDMPLLPEYKVQRYFADGSGGRGGGQQTISLAASSKKTAVTTMPTSLAKDSAAAAPSTRITINNPVALYVLSPSAVAKPSTDGLSLGVINGSVPVFTETITNFTMLERLRQAIQHHVCTGTPMPVPILSLLSSLLTLPCEATEVDTSLGRPKAVISKEAMERMLRKEADRKRKKILADEEARVAAASGGGGVEGGWQNV